MAQSIICAVNIMKSSQHWKEEIKRPYGLQTFLKNHSAAQDFQMDFGMDLHLAYIHCAIGKAQFLRVSLIKSYFVRTCYF